MNTDWLDAIHEHLERRKKMKVWDNPMRQVIGDGVLRAQRDALQAAIDELVAARNEWAYSDEEYEDERLDRAFTVARRLASK
jgi:hypothetical protein